MRDRAKREDFTAPNGDFDHVAFRAARVLNGECCIDCESWIWTPPGHCVKCGDCQALDGADEVTHDDYIRCPKCRASFDAVGDDNYELYGDGEHDVACPTCDHEFEVCTNVSYSFTSPELIQDEADDS